MTTLQPVTLADITSIACDEARRAGIVKRIAALETAYKKNHLIVRVSFDVQPGTWGANIGCNRAGLAFSPRRTIDMYGAETVDRLLDRMDQWLRDTLVVFLDECDAHDAESHRPAFFRTPQDVATVAKDLWLAVNAYVHHSDNSAFDERKPPAAVSRWLGDQQCWAVPQDICRALCAEHLKASTTWMHLAVSNPVHRVKVDP